MKKLFYGLLVLALSVTAHSNDEYLSLLETVTLSAVGQQAISPNGDYVAYTKVTPRTPYVDEDGAHYVTLHVVSNSGKERTFIGGKVGISNIAWDPKGQHIYYLAKRNDDKKKSIYKIAIDGGESEKVFSFVSDISAFSINHTGDKLVFLSKENTKTEKEKLAKKGFKAEIYEEDQDFTHVYLLDLTQSELKDKQVNIAENVLSVKFSPKADELLVRVAPSAHIDDNYTSSFYKIVNLSGKVIQTFATEGKLGEAEWSPSATHIAMIAAEDKHDPSAGRLALAEVKSGKVSQVLNNYMGQVQELVWQTDHQVTFLGHVGTVSEVAKYNLDSKAVEPFITQSDEVIRTLSTNAKGDLSAVASSALHPREVFKVEEGKLVRLTNTNPILASKKMPKQLSISYKARDGVELQGVFIYPSNYKKGKRYPLIMMVHGGPEAHISDEWLDRYSNPIKYAASKGFAVFLPNYRGSTARGVEFSKMGQADYAGAEFNDLVDAITHLDKEGLIDKNRVGITGGSYGGYASAWGATALSEHFAASVMFVGISNQLSKFGTTDIPGEMHDVHARYYPWEKWQWMLERSPIYHTDKANTPLLIMHGKEDTRVHPAQSMELYRYIKVRSPQTPVRLVYYPGEGHGNRKVAAQLDYAERLMQWMTFYLMDNVGSKEMPTFDLKHSEKLKKEK